MKKTKKKASKKDAKKGGIIVTVSRLGEDPFNVNLPKGATVEKALAAAGLDLTGREKAFVEGDEADEDDVLENGDILSIVTPKQAGSN